MKYPLSFLLLVLFKLVPAQLQRNYTSYSVDNGLAQNSVWDAFQDYKGFMWLGTADGITRLDGDKIKQYRPHLKDSSSLAGSTSLYFFEDSRKQLWISHNKGISLYNRQRDCFFNIRIHTKNQLKSESHTRLLGEDARGNIWCWEMGAGLYCISPTGTIIDTVAIRNLKHQPAGILNAVLSGDFIFGSLDDGFKTFFRYSISSKRIDLQQKVHQELISYSRINDSLFCHYDPGKLLFYHVKQNRFSERLLIPGAFPFPKRCSYSRMLFWQGRYWLGNNHGLFVFDSALTRIKERILSFNPKEEVGFHYIENLKTDLSGNLWICTNGAGVFSYSPYRNKFLHYSTAQSRFSLIRSIAVDSEGDIYTGVFGEGIVKFNRNGDVQVLPWSHWSPNLNHVLAVLADGPNLFYVKQGLLQVYNQVTRQNRTLHYPASYTQKNGEYMYAPCLRKIDSQIYYSSDFQIFKLNKSYQLQPILPYKLFQNQITAVEKVNDSIWWVGSNKELFIANLRTGKLRQLPGRYFVKTIYYQKSQKRIWVGCNTGLFLFDLNGKQIKQFETQPGFPDDFVYGILEDKHGALWLSTNKGLSLFNSQTNTFTNYSVKDGLQSNEFNTGAYYKDEKGLLYFGGVNGVNVIDPDAVPINKNEPRIAINQILVGDLPMATDSAYNELSSLVLPYKQNTLSFDFAALEFSQPEENTYKYILEGYDKNWIESGKLHFARYANLPPGDYVFKVVAANGDGFWCKTPRALFISITPPFWETSWFYGLCVLLGVGLIGLAMYVFLRFQRRKLERAYEVQRNLEAERLRISRDLHDNVGAQLSYLITNVDWMLNHPDQLDQAEERKRLEALSEAGRNAILTLRQTIWAISNSSLSVDDFSDRFKQFVLKLLEFNAAVQVEFYEDFSESRSLSPALALNAFRIAQEAFSNALRHSNATKLRIEFISNNQLLFQIRIVDNGDGFDWKEGQSKGHYGLKNMQSRASEMGAELLIESNPGEGTQVSLIIKA